MVINNDPNYEKNKKNEERLNRTEEERKDALFAELRKESSSIICLAVMYAKNFEETGEDITQKWITAEQQADALQRYYDKGFRQGYQEGIQKGREYERKKMEKFNKKLNKGSPANGGGNFNGQNRHGTV